MISDQALAFGELSFDLLYHKIPQGKHQYYIDRSIEEGKRIVQHYRYRSIKELYEENKIQIKLSNHQTSYFGVKFRAQFHFNKKGSSVTLYQNSLSELSAMASQEINGVLTYQRALDMHLCHEFFHYHEAMAGESVAASLDSIITMKLPLFARKAKITRCSEIAAHAFTKEMLGLGQLPNLYDYLYLISKGELPKDYLQQLTMQYHEVTGNAERKLTMLNKGY